MNDVALLLDMLRIIALVAIAFWLARLARAASHIARQARRLVDFIERNAK